MNEEEIKRAKMITIKALEEYLNNHQFELERRGNIARNTNDYLILNAYKDNLIEEVYKNDTKTM